VLGALIGVAPHEVRLKLERFGKPELARDYASQIRFNLSHSGDLALLAVSRGPELGVDLELEREDVDVLELGATVFSPAEIQVLEALTARERRAHFFRLWACKEAVIKAEGTGFSLSTRTFTVELPALGPPRLIHCEGDAPRVGRWSLTELQPAPGFAAALAVEGAPREILFWDADAAL
jgi:4'-phosphopantetheinyl transferase